MMEPWGKKGLWIMEMYVDDRSLFLDGGPYKISGLQWQYILYILLLNKYICSLYFVASYQLWVIYDNVIAATLYLFL